jgi:hypothetical protein
MFIEASVCILEAGEERSRNDKEWEMPNQVQEKRCRQPKANACGLEAWYSLSLQPVPNARVEKLLTLSMPRS